MYLKNYLAYYYGSIICTNFTNKKKYLEFLLRFSYEEKYAIQSQNNILNYSQNNKIK